MPVCPRKDRDASAKKMDLPLILLISYGLGCFCTGYYLTRWRTGQDIRQLGSGNVGARNVGRVLGPVGFGLTLLGDTAKGAAAVWLALDWQLSLGGVILALLAAVAGHMWPVQIGFRGGKGIATGLGGMLVFDLWLVAIMLVLVGLVGLVIRHSTVSGLIVITTTPLIAWIRGYPLPVVVGLALLAPMILFAHRGNIRAFVRARRR